ncbi:peroxidase 5 [Brachypodium distachyon]|uniref:Peroxidase n=1 Tax=Brachypodium distachyon TaxID=15368 RepID=A0A0Q3FHP1_BRADI|nr:peroxidase 5 [Brachypodium distachyon]KQJ97596.1 hypothetical protein BRADI_3g32110v3 [Brachypodium distachyon]|eukprot:XP_014756014.1 peroxidase 5 [Brachypodium distachyon]
MGRSSGVVVLVAVVAGMLLCVAEAQTQLKPGYYDQTCKDAEAIVFDEVRKAWNADRSVPAALLRLHFHDCFVNGCDGSVLLESWDRQAEKDAPPNKSLRGYEVIDRAKARLEMACRQTVSCADILAYAARDSVKVATGGFHYAVPGGRPDGTVSRATMANSNLPPPTQRNVDLLAQAFINKGLSKDDLIVLSGAHTLGVTRCGTFDYRLSNSNDKGMDPWFLNSLRAQCNRDASRVVPLDDGSQFAFDTKYYANVIANRGVLESDAALNSPSTVARVRQLRDGTPQTFHGAFAAAMGRMGALRGANPGKVRDHCRRVRT